MRASLALLAAVLALGPAPVALAKPPPKPAKAKPAPPKPILALTVAATEGVALDPEALARFADALRAELARQAGGRFELDPPAAPKKVTRTTPRGHRLRATIAKRTIEPDGAKTKVAIEVRATISTWPEDHLRFVITAKANASAEAPLAVIEPPVLAAAIADAVRDSLAELERPPAKPRPKVKR